jgi:RecA-family ATPase
MEGYINNNLNKFKYYNSPNWITLQRLEQIIEIWAMDGYQLFVVDTFSRIQGNLEKDARNNQNKCMEELQELAQRLGIAIVMLHHTNRSGTWEGSQKIMDLSNVFIVITKEEDGEWVEYRNYKLMKDKYVVNKEVDVYYYWGRYEKF